VQEKPQESASALFPSPIKNMLVSPQPPPSEIAASDFVLSAPKNFAKPRVVFNSIGSKGTKGVGKADPLDSTTPVSNPFVLANRGSKNAEEASAQAPFYPLLQSRLRVGTSPTGKRIPPAPPASIHSNSVKTDAAPSAEASAAGASSAGMRVQKAWRSPTAAYDRFDDVPGRSTASAEEQVQPQPAVKSAQPGLAGNDKKTFLFNPLRKK
jgi:hypothetical protein